MSAMGQITLRSLWAHKRRLISTLVSVVLGVAFLSGTFVFTDTLDQVFTDLFSRVSKGLDTRVQGEELFSSDDFGGSQRARFDQSVLEAVRRVEGVRVAEPAVATEGFGSMNRVLDENGDTVGSSNGPPTIVQSWVADDQINPFDLTDRSRAPATDDEVALNVAAAADGNFRLGDMVTIASQFGNKQYRLVGTFTLGNADSAAGAVSVAVTLAEAQRLAGAQGKLDEVLVAAKSGVSESVLTARIARVIPDGVEAITGKQAEQQDADRWQEGFGFFRIALTIFAGIALLVAVFIISNTFQILVAQRGRELALVRAIGATRSQVLRSVLFEALVVGLIAAALGVAGGVGLAAGISALLGALGADLPSGGLVVRPRAVVTGLSLGVVVTMIAALSPAIRATRVAPIAALRDVAFEHARMSKLRVVLGVIVLGFAVMNMSRAIGAEDTDVVPTVGTGALALVFGAIILGPLLAGQTVLLLGVLLPKLRGITGLLAVENAARSPKRTASTASALLIGIALIGFITVFAASAKESVTRGVERGFSGDLVIQSEGGGFQFSGFSPEVAQSAANVDGVEVVASVASGPIQVTYPDGDTAVTFAQAVDTESYRQVAAPKMKDGSLEDLTPGRVLVDRQIADDNDLSVDDKVTITLQNGSELNARIGGISDDLVVLGPWTVVLDDYRALTDQDLDTQVLVGVQDGMSVEKVKNAVELALKPFPAVEVLDRDEWVGDLANTLATFVNVLYGLLALSIVIGAIGVANTLSLSVHERTREIGLLRAVGMTRGQLRSLIRWEAVIIAALGTLVGLFVGLVASYAVIRSMKGFGLETFALPVGSLAGWATGFVLLGVIASLRTAHRASKLQILEAIATE